MEPYLNASPPDSGGEAIMPAASIHRPDPSPDAEAHEHLLVVDDTVTEDRARFEIRGLSGINLEIPQGKIVGIIGPSGSGKSTLPRALNRLWEPPSGDIKNLDVLSHRRNVGMQFQLPVMFEGAPSSLSTASAFDGLPQLATDSCPTQIIHGDGTFDIVSLQNLIDDVRLSECGLSYSVVSIMGPQGSGKSTLLNHLFGTNFREMDASQGRSQTTKGVWLAKAAGIEPCTLVMDLEGTDGSTRGDDTAFEKQSALFALAISDVVLINTWCYNVGLHQAANWPLLETLFELMIRLFSPRKTTLLFVIRDQTRTPLEKLEPDLREDVRQIWDSVPKPQAHKETPLSEFFNVEVVALSSYEWKEEQFKEQVASLRQRFFHSSAPGGLIGDRKGVVPGSGFSLSAQQMWQVIKENKDLDLPALKVMVATVRCEETAREKYSSFTENEDWRLIEEDVQWVPVPGFVKKVSSILEACLSGYDREVAYYDENVRSSMREQLEENLLQLVEPAFQSMLRHVLFETLDEFKEAFDKALNEGKGFSVAAHDCTQSFMTLFDKGCADALIEQAKWDTSGVREKLRRDIDAHVASVLAAKLSERTKAYEANLNAALSGPVEAVLDEAKRESWSTIRKILSDAIELEVTGFFSGALSDIEMDEQNKKTLLSGMQNYARGVVEAKAREKARRVAICMRDRFATVFNHAADDILSVWTLIEEIRAVSKPALLASLELLSVTAAVRLDDATDNIERTLLALLNTEPNATDRSIATVDPLALSTWEGIPSSETLIAPVQCKLLWRQFKMEAEYIVTEYIVNRAISALEAGNRPNNLLDPRRVGVLLMLLGPHEMGKLIRG